MANTSSAEKAMRVSERRRNRNRIIRASARTKARQAVASIGEGDMPATEQAVRDAIRALDKAAEKGIIKKNAAARRKSRLMKRLNQFRASKAQA